MIHMTLDALMFTAFLQCHSNPVAANAADFFMVQNVKKSRLGKTGLRFKPIARLHDTPCLHHPKHGGNCCAKTQKYSSQIIPDGKNNTEMTRPMKMILQYQYMFRLRMSPQHGTSIPDTPAISSIHSYTQSCRHTAIKHR